MDVRRRPRSRTICSSNSECMTIAAAPASSSRRTVSRSSTSGEAPGMSGCGSSKPEVGGGEVHARRSSRSTVRPSARRPAPAGPVRSRQICSYSANRCDRAVAGPPRQLARTAPGPAARPCGSASRCACTRATVTFGGAGVEHQRRLARRDAPRVEAVQRPDAGVDRQLLLVQRRAPGRSRARCSGCRR